MKTSEIAFVVATVMSKIEDTDEYSKLTSDDKLIVLKTTASILENQIAVCAVMKSLEISLSKVR
jgi:hypothetical protein